MQQVVADRRLCVIGKCTCVCSECPNSLTAKHTGRTRGPLAAVCSQRCGDRRYRRDHADVIKIRNKNKTKTRGRVCRFCCRSDDLTSFGSMRDRCQSCAQNTYRRGLTPCCQTLWASWSTPRVLYCPACPGTGKAEIIILHPLTGQERTTYHPRFLFTQLIERARLASAEELVIEAKTPRHWHLGVLTYRDRIPGLGVAGLVRCQHCRLGLAPGHDPRCNACVRAGLPPSRRGFYRGLDGVASLEVPGARFMSRCGSRQHAILSRLATGPRPVTEFQAHRDVLISLVRRGLIKIVRPT